MIAFTISLISENYVNTSHTQLNTLVDFENSLTSEDERLDESIVKRALRFREHKTIDFTISLTSTDHVNKTHTQQNTRVDFTKSRSHHKTIDEICRLKDERLDYSSRRRSISQSRSRPKTTSTTQKRTLVDFMLSNVATQTRCLDLAGHFLQMSPAMRGSFAERALQQCVDVIKCGYADSPSSSCKMKRLNVFIWSTRQ